MTANIEINTARFGLVVIPADKVILFKNGLPGFEEIKKYVLLDHGDDGVFKWLQAVDDPETAFLLTIPNLFKENYSLPQVGLQLSSIGIKSGDEPVVMVMVCIPKGGGQYITLNLKAPLVFNDNTMSGMQCIVEHNDYTCDFRVDVVKADSK